VVKEATGLNCEHVFCKECITNHLNRQQLCPQCRQAASLGDIHAIGFLDLQVKKQQVYCPNKDAGCDWKGVFSDSKIHQEQKCELEEVKCNECNKSMQRRLMFAHSGNCELRKVNCQYCRMELKFNETNDHNKICKEIPIECPNNCDEKNLVRKNLQQHQATCPNADIQCPYSNWDVDFVVSQEFKQKCFCDARFQRSHLQDHLNKFMSQHLLIVESRLQAIANNQSQINQQNQANQQQIQELKEILQPLQNLLQRAPHFWVNIANIEQEQERKQEEKDLADPRNWKHTRKWVSDCFSFLFQFNVSLLFFVVLFQFKHPVSSSFIFSFVSFFSPLSL